MMIEVDRVVKVVWGMEWSEWEGSEMMEGWIETMERRLKRWMLESKR